VPLVRGLRRKHADIGAPPARAGLGRNAMRGPHYARVARSLRGWAAKCGLGALLDWYASGNMCCFDTRLSRPYVQTVCPVGSGAKVTDSGLA
jgi:hypothetical protein